MGAAVTDEFGGMLVADEFGGIPVKQDEFGGIAIAAEPELPQDIPITDAQPAPAPEQPSPITPERAAWADSVSNELDALKQDLAHATMDIQVSKGSGEAFDRKQAAQNQIDAYEASLLENTPWHPAARRIIARTQPVFEHDGDLYDTETATPIRDPKDPRIHEWIASKVSRDTPGAFKSGAAQFSSGIMSQVAGGLRAIAPSIGSAPATAMSEQAAGAGELARRNDSATAGLARGVGGAGALIAGNPSGKVGLLTGGARAALQTETEARAAGASSEESAAAARKALALLPAYMAGGAIAGKLGTKLAGDAASPLAKGLSGGVAATAGNVAMSGTLAAIEGHPYTAENLGMDVAFGGLHGVGEGRKASVEVKASEQAAQRDVQDIIGGTDGVPQGTIVSMNKTLAERAAMLRPLSTEEAKVVATEGLDALEKPAPPLMPEGATKIERPGQPEIGSRAPDYDPEGMGQKAWVEKRMAEGVSREQAVQEITDSNNASNAWLDSLPTGSVVRRPGFKATYTKESDGTLRAEDGSVWSGITKGAELVSTPPTRNLGPGAANIEEPLPSGPATSNVEDVVNQERAERQLDPVLKDARIGNEAALDAAETTLESNPTRGQEIVSRLREADPFERTISREDAAVLLVEKVKIRNERDAMAERAADEAASPEERAIAQQEWERLEGRIAEMDQAAQDARSVWGGFGQFWQRQLREDFTFEAMERRARVEKQGPLTETESATIKEQAEKIQKLTTELDKVTKTKDEEAAGVSVDESIRQIEADAKADPSFTPEVRSIVQRFSGFLSSAADAARKRMRERLANLSANPFLDPMYYADAVIVGADAVNKGFLTFARWSGKMVSEFGEAVKPHLQRLWKDTDTSIDEQIAKKVHPKHRTKVKSAISKTDAVAKQAEIAANLTESAKEGTPLTELRSDIARLAENFVRGGITEREPLIDAVHEVLVGLDPAITRRQTMDLISGYGDFRPLNADAVKAQLRDLKGQMQQVSKLDDITAKEPLLKTGVERRTPSTEERQLIQQVNEAKRKFGVVVTDPAKQLKSALDARKTYVRNRLTDLRTEIANRTRIVTERSLPPTDAELEALRAEYDTVKAEHDTVFGKAEMSDEQRLKGAIAAAERSEAQWAKKLEDAKRGVFPAARESKVPKSVQLDAIKARREALAEQVKELKLLANPPLSAAQRALDSALVARERWQQVIAGEADPARKVPREALTQLEEDARLEISAMRELAAEVRRDTAPKADPDVATIRALEKATADYEARLKAADFSARGRKQGPDTAAVAKVRALRDAAKKAFDAAKAATKPKLTADEVAIQALKARAKARIAELQEKLAKGDFSTRKRKEYDLSKDPDAVRLQTEKDTITKEFQKQQAKWKADREWEQKTATEKLIHGIKLGWQAIRNLKLSFDLTGTIQSAQAMARHPVQGVKAIGRGTGVFLNSFLTQQSKYAKRLQTQIEMSPNNKNGLYKRMGLDLRMGDKRDENAASVLERLADLQTRWAGVPDVVKGLMNMDGRQLVSGAKQLALFAPKIAGRGLRASNEAFQAIVNGMRAVSADAIINRNFRHTAPSKQQAELLGNHVNASTGSGGLRGQEGLRALLFAPNWYLSLLKSLTGQPLLKALYKHEGKVAGIIAADYIRSIATLGVLLGLRELFDDKNKGKSALQVAGKVIDPKNLLDPQAGTVKMPGGSIVDLTQSRAAWASLLARFAMGKKMEGGRIEKERRDQALLNFIRGRLSQEIRTGIMVASQENYFGKKLDAGQLVAEVVTPLSWNSVDKVIKAEGMTRGSFLQLLNFVFGNVKPPKKN